MVELGYFQDANELISTLIKGNDIYDKSKLFCYLGLSCYAQGKYCSAKSNLSHSVNLKGFFSNEAYCWLKLLHIIDSYRPKYVIRTEFLNIHFIDDLKSSVRKRFLDKYISSYDRIQRFFNSTLPKSIDVFVYKDHKDSNNNPLSYTNAPLSAIHVFWNDESGHELAHVISHHIIGGENNIHPFVQEGVAECFNLDAYSYLEDSVIINTSIDDLWEHFENYDKRFAYKVAKLFFLLLLRCGGREKLLCLINDQRIENAKKIYGELFSTIKGFVEREISLKSFLTMDTTNEHIQMANLISHKCGHTS